MIHNSLRLKRQEDIYKPRKTDSFCENFLIWLRYTVIHLHSDFDKKILKKDDFEKKHVIKDNR